MSNYLLSDLFAKGGFALIVLVLCLLFIIEIIIEKWIVYKGIREKVINDFKKKIFDILAVKAPKDAIYICYSYSVRRLFFKIKCLLSNIYIHILENTAMDKEDLTGITISKINNEMIRKEKGLGILSTLGIISPLIGLLGTIIGIIYSFKFLAAYGASARIEFMDRIAESLIPTAAGFLIAIIAVIFKNYFSNQLKLGRHFIEDSSFELIRKLKSNDKVNDYEYLQEK